MIDPSLTSITTVGETQAFAATTIMLEDNPVPLAVFDEWVARFNSYDPFKIASAVSKDAAITKNAGFAGIVVACRIEWGFEADGGIGHLPADAIKAIGIAVLQRLFSEVSPPWQQ